MTISKRKSNNKVATKVRVDLELEKRARQSEEYILVREKYKPFKKIKNSNYNPDNNRRTR
jgi:hypothetical protein